MLKLLFLNILCSSFYTAISQIGLCPTNLDFELGNFNNWAAKTGNVALSGGLNTITMTGNGVVLGRHTLLPNPSGTDYYGGFSTTCSNGSGFSVKLGNNSTGAQAESLSYTYTIPSTLTKFSMIFNYAVVFQDPTDHSPEEKPRFRARIIDLTNGNTPIGCSNFDFTASSNLPGFHPSPVSPNVWYKEWTPITLDLSPYIGHTIKLEFITSDCTRGGHFGYAYIDVNSTCNGAIIGTTICPGDSVTTLNAPFGFQTYAWYSDNTYTNLISNTQTLTISPTPTVGAIFPVIVTPYPSFGCLDTLYANLTLGNKPISNAGNDTFACKYGTVQIGTTPRPDYNYEWSPASLVDNPFISNPLAYPPSSTPTQLIVKTKDILSDCFSFDTVFIANKIVDNSIQLDGASNFCLGQLKAKLLVNAASTQINWYENSTGIIQGANSIFFQPNVSGNYWAAITQSGCRDSTALISIIVHPLPIVQFNLNSDTGCVTKNSFAFLNTTTLNDNSPLSYLWKISTNDSFETININNYSFNKKGRYWVKLYAKTDLGCMDSSMAKTIYILPNGQPNFNWDSICINRAFLFHNLSNENGSTQVGYDWNFNNNLPHNFNKNPLPVTYANTNGMLDVSLTLTTLGCENDPQSITHTVLINKPKIGISYKELTVPQDAYAYIHVRDSIGNNFTWRPQVQLSSYTTQYTQFFATGADIKYLIDIKDKHTCITTDTMSLNIYRKPAYIMPTAFTPNGDGLNDVATPYLIHQKTLKAFYVYDRWGNTIFFTTTPNKGWDGTYKHMPSDAGVYIWLIDYIDNTNILHHAKGTITLIR